MPSRELVEYTLTTPGVDIAIMGIGAISNEHRECQLTQNLSAAQVHYDSLSATDRRNIEERAGMMGRDSNGLTNDFQQKEIGLSAVANPQLKSSIIRGHYGVELTWDSAIAGDDPIRHYNVLRNGKKMGTVPHRPQISKEPFRYTDAEKGGSREYAIETVDMEGRTVSSEVLIS